MKQLITTLFLAFALFLSQQTQAQYCGSSMIDSSACGFQANQGFEDLDSIPCIVQGAITNLVVPFRNYVNFTAQGHTISVKRLRIDTMSNLPCGLCWSTSRADNSFLGGDLGCFKFHGMTNDAAGEYKIHLILDVNSLATDTNYTYRDINADLGGVYFYLRVVAPGGNCPAVDTSAGATKRTASCDTFNLHVGIHDISANLKNLTIQPNPMTSEAAVTFISETGGAQQITITNVVGSEVYNTTIMTKQGLNETTINRNNLPAGMYILSVGSSQGIATRKFIISE